MILFAPTALASPKLTTATISTIAATLPTNNTASVRLLVDFENLVIDSASKFHTIFHLNVSLMNFVIGKKLLCLYAIRRYLEI